MKLQMSLVLVLGLLLSACANRLKLESEDVKKAVPFCSVAEPQPSIKGDPARTKEQKAYNNGLGIELCDWKDIL
jgi:hypothetical protein